MLKELREAWFHLSECCSVIIITSEGHPAFCGGADLTEIVHKTATDAFSHQSQTLFNEIAISSVVSIAAVHGAAVAGGCELALSCDLRVVSPEAYFSLPEVSLGLIPSAGGCTRLSNLIGSSRARAIILGGERITAQQAVICGLAHRVAKNPLDEAQKWAQQISDFDPMALRLAKRVLIDPTLAKERICESILYQRKQNE